MADRKKNILWDTEATFLATGFSTLSYEILKRLHKNRPDLNLVELGCIPDPWAKIAMSNGSLKPICYIKEGDYVTSHTGRSRRVTKTFEKDFSGKIVIFDRFGFGGTRLKTTDNHPILIIRKENVIPRGKKRQSEFKQSEKMEWIRADEIKKGDFACYANPDDFYLENNFIEIDEFKISLNDDFALVAGWFLAEGCIIKNKQLGVHGISACFNYEKEQQILVKFCNAFKNIFKIDIVSIYHRPDIGVSEIKIMDRDIARFFAKCLGFSCYDKILDRQFWNAPKNFIIKMISAYAEGDGCCQKDRNDLSIKTASHRLGLDVTRILLKHNIRTKFLKSKDSCGYTIRVSGQHAEKICKFFIVKTYEFKELAGENSFKVGNLIFYKIRNIQKMDFVGKVYNLEVDVDNTYVCNNYVVHNSYASNSDPKSLDLPWKFYGSVPDPNDEVLTRRYNGSPYGQFGEAMFEKVLLEEQIQCVIGCRDFWMCVASGDVWLAGGDIKPVSEIKVGDEVLTHNNRFRKVIKTGNRVHNGKFVKILTDRVCFPVELTDNHPVLRIPNRLKIYRSLPQESHFVEASEIKKNDHLVFPIPVFEEEKVSFNDQEIAHISFTKEFGGNEIPRWVFHLPMRQRYIFLQNLLRSTGYYSREKKLAKYNTTSKHFAKQLWTLILSMRIDACVKETRKIDKSGKHYFTYTVQIAKREFHRIEEIYREGEANRPSLSSRIYGDYLVLCVKNVEYSEGSKIVYNLQVEEDETFTCGFATHNCSEWQMKSPFRDKFKYIYMPTMDGSPQRSVWTHGYSEADLLLSQADYGRDLLENHGYKKLKVFGTVNPGVDPEVFKPIPDKKELRKKAGIPENAKIIVSLMRNQKRKLFPDVLDMFNEYIRYCVDHDNKDLAENTYLYWHTSYPDVGFDLGRLILESGLGHRIFLTYTCGRCKCFYPDFFQSEVSICRQCGAQALHMPNTQHGISREDLALVYNIGDCLLQYAVCIAKGQKVLLDRGWTNIEEAKIGDLALTHKGRYMPIINTFINKHSDDLVELSVVGDYAQTKMTKDHEILSLRKKDLCPNQNKNTREYLGDILRSGKNFPEPKFHEIGTLDKDDVVFYPIDDTVSDVSTIDLADYAADQDVILNDTINVKYGHIYPRYIEVNNDFCKLIGLFAADGNASFSSSNQSKITCNINEQNNIDLAKSVFEKISNKKSNIKEYNGRNAVDVTLYSSLLNRFFQKNFFRHELKKMPDFVSRLPVEKQKNVLIGMFMGDGCYVSRKNGNIGSSIYATISKNLADQLKNILRRLRINFACKLQERKCNDGKSRRKQYRFEIPGQLKGGYLPNQKRINSRKFYWENYHVMPIESILPIEYNEPHVYTLEVEEDHSYILENTGVKNCEGYGMSLPEAKACGLPVFATDYSAMQSHLNFYGGFPIKVEKYFYEGCMETEQRRALPDNTDCVKKLYGYFTAPEASKKKMSEEARKDAVENHSYDRAAKIFEQAIDSLELYDHKETWLNPKQNFLQMPDRLPNFQSNGELVDFLIANVIKKPHYLNSPWRSLLVKSLNVGYLVGKQGFSKEQFTRDKIMQMFAGMVSEHNYWESQRLSKLDTKDRKNAIPWRIV